MKFKLLFITLLFGVFSWGQILTYDFVGLAGNEASATSNFNDPNLGTSTITRGAGLTASPNGDRFNATSWAATSIANAVTGNDYVEFTITPNAGFQFSVSSIVFQLQRSGTGLTAIALRSSADGYAANLDTEKAIVDNTATQTITFTFAQPNSPTSVTYRLYGYAEAATGTGGPGDGTGNDIVVNGSVTSTCTAPTIQASVPASSSVTTNSGTIGFTRGNGTSVLVVARAGGLVDADPVSGTPYTANAVFGSGTQIGTGNFVVYNGNASPGSVNVTGLTSATAYYFAIYEYVLATNCYNLVQLLGSFTTQTIVPNVTLANNGTQIAAANVPQNTTNHVLHQFQLSVTSANATLSGIGCTTTGTYVATDITNLKVRYSADAILDGADVTLSTLTNPGIAGAKTFPAFTAQVIANSTTGYVFITADIAATAIVGNTISVAPITTANTTFVSASKTGSTTAGGIQTIAVSAPNIPTNFTEVCTSNTTQTLSWSPPVTGTFDGYILVVREAAVPNAVTSIVASSQSSNLNYTLAPTYNATTSRVLYIGTGTTAVVTGLTQGISYTFALHTYNNNGASTIYSSAVTTSQVIVLPNVTSAIATPQNASANLAWANPAAACYDEVLVVVTAAPGITFAPTGDGTAYTANSVFSGFNQVVYASSGNLVNITGLTNGVTYYLELFVRNGTEWSSGVEVSVTPVNIVPTVLKTGDLLLVAYFNNLTGGDDTIRLLTFVDINPGTKFLWTNATYETGGNPAANVRTDKWFECRFDVAPTGNVPYIEFTYNGTTTIPAASIFCITTVNSGTGTTISAVSPAGVNFSAFSVIGKSADGTVLTTHSPVNVSTSNADAMFLLQGNFIYNATGSTFNGTVLSSVQDGGLWYDLTDDLTTASGNNLRRSRKHPSLLCASIQGNVTPGTYQVSYNVSTTTYTTGNKPYLLGSILNFSTNWISSFGTCPTFSPFVINPSDPFNRWTGALSTNWFDCYNWALLTVPDELTDVSIFSSATNNPVVDANAPFSDGFFDVAECKDLTISGRTLFLQSAAAVASRLDVAGNLVIDTSGILDMGDANVSSTETINLSGNWTNTLTTTAFDEGLGTVNFTGSTTQIINNNVHTNTEQFYTVGLNNDFNTAVSNNIIATGNLNIETNKVVTVAGTDFIRVNKALNHNGTLAIANNGQLIQVDESDTNSGDYSGSKFQLERTALVKSLDYVYWSAPTENFAVSLIPTNYRYEWSTLFNNANGTQGNWVAAAGNTTKGKGYIARASNGAATAQALTATFTGKPNNGQFTLQIERGTFDGVDFDAEAGNANNVLTTKYDDNWNLVGNPYPSAIDAEEFLVLNQTKIEGSIWVWKHGLDPSSLIDPYYSDFQYNYSSNDYIKYNGLGSTEPDTFNGKIASGQGFMVNMLHAASTPNTITFANSLRSDASFATYDNTDFFRSSPTSSNGVEEKHRIWLDIINSTSGQMDRMLLGYSSNSTFERDHMYDCIYVPRSEVSLFSLINSEPFIIQGRPLPFNDSDVVPLGAKIVAEGNHTIAIKKTDGLFLSNQTIYLEDKQLNIIHDLTQSPYNFVSPVGTFNNRFVLRFSNTTLSNDENSAHEGSVIVAVNGGQIAVKSNLENIASVTIYDIIGREILNAKNIDSNEVVFNSIRAKNQTLIVKVVLINGQTTTRKIIL